MKKFLIILFIMPVIILHGQKVNFEWAKQMAGADLVDARGLATVTDATGNIFTTGFFKGTVDFDSGPGIYNLDPVGTQDFYIAKLDSGGNFLWVKQMDLIGAFMSATCKSIAIDADANIVVTGEITEFVNNSRCFICKLDSSGNLLWSRLMDGPSGGTSIKTDALGNIYTAGLFSGTIDFDPGPGDYILGNALFFTSPAFVSKLDANGNFIWAKEIAGYYEADAGGGGSLYGQLTNEVFIAVDDLQSVYISGSFYGTVDFDPGPARHLLSQANYISNAKEMFILKLSGEGNFAWARQMGGNNENVAIAIAVDAFGNTYTGGNFVGTADFDPGPGVYNLTAENGVSNTVISKLDGNGNFVWAKQLAGGAQWCYSMTLDKYGNVYTTGYFGKTMDFDPGPGTYTLLSSGYDVFISKINPDGNFVWAQQVSGTAKIISNSIVVDALGNVITTGYFFGGSADFDPGNGSFHLTSGEGENIFIQKLGQCLVNYSSVTHLSTCKNYTLNGQTYTTSGIYTQTLRNDAGCDSIITLQLEIKPITHVITVAACNDYSLNGKVYSSSGVYYDTLASTNGCDSIVTLRLDIAHPTLTTITRSICEGQTYEGYSVSGIYSDTLAAANGCDSIAILNLSVLPKPVPDLGADNILCTGDSLLLHPGKFATYTWQDGSTQDHITIKQPGFYSVMVTDNCGTGKDEIIIKEGNCDVYFPKAFTPNNDGINDWFKILKPANLTYFHLSVFNRLGQKVFETFDHLKGWNGSFNGQLLPMQTLVWYCELKRQGTAKKINTRGLVTLVR